MKWMPTIQGLRALESFARHGSVSKAAEEMRLTRSAVSHQLRLLEDAVGFQLFERFGSRIELTEHGRGFALDVRGALNTIVGSAVRYGDSGLSGRITVSCPPGFASSWLCSHIGGFSDLHPDIDLSVATPLWYDDVSNTAADVFIAFGEGSWPNMRSELLAKSEFIPLCSPALYSGNSAIKTPSDLRNVKFLHMINDIPYWDEWMALAGLDPSIAHKGVTFADMNLAYSAAVAGQGVFLGDEFLCRAAISNGLLVSPFDLYLPSKESYYLVVSPARADSKPVVAFCEWLRNEVRENAAGSRAATL